MTDGLVPNVSLILRVAGASSGDARTVVLAGAVGLIAGSLSMAIGDDISVRSKLELLDYQSELQRQQRHWRPTAPVSMASG